MVNRKEKSIAPYGFEVHKCELSPEKRLPVTHRGRWPGLTAIDGAIFEAFVIANQESIQEIYTDVPCGLCALPPEWMRNDAGRRQLEAIYPLRIDAIVKAGGIWHVVEVKPDAGYGSLGQVLTYIYWAKLTCPDLAEAMPCVVTDRVQDAVKPVFEQLNVTVFEVDL